MVSETLVVLSKVTWSIAREDFIIDDKCYRIYSIVSRPFLFHFSLPKNAHWLRISVICKRSILQVSVTSQVCEAYSTVRGQCEHILHILWLFSVLHL
jgi:hypothetical protein